MFLLPLPFFAQVVELADTQVSEASSVSVRRPLFLAIVKCRPVERIRPRVPCHGNEQVSTSHSALCMLLRPPTPKLTPSALSKWMEPAFPKRVIPVQFRAGIPAVAIASEDRRPDGPSGLCRFRRPA